MQKKGLPPLVPHLDESLRSGGYPSGLSPTLSNALTHHERISFLLFDLRVSEG